MTHRLAVEKPQRLTKYSLDVFAVKRLLNKSHTCGWIHVGTCVLYDSEMSKGENISLRI